MRSVPNLCRDFASVTIVGVWITGYVHGFIVIITLVVVWFYEPPGPPDEEEEVEEDSEQEQSEEEQPKQPEAKKPNWNKARKILARGVDPIPTVIFAEPSDNYKEIFDFRCEVCNIVLPEVPLRSECPYCHQRFDRNEYQRRPKESATLKMEKKPEPEPLVEDVECDRGKAGRAFVDKNMGRAAPPVCAKFWHWRRIGEASPKGQPWELIDMAKGFDLKQGLVDDSAVVACILALERVPHLLQHIFLTKTVNARGYYRLRLYIYGAWKVVELDDIFPHRYPQKGRFRGEARGNLTLLNSNNRQLAPCLIEKAIAKLYSYAYIDALCVDEILTLLTGAAIQTRQASNPECANIVVTALADSAMVVACSLPELPESPLEGICTSQNYAVVSFFYLNDDLHLQLADPQASDVWPECAEDFGMVLDDCSLLYPHGYERNTFWMPYDQFVDHFGAVVIAHLLPDWTETRHVTKVGMDPSKCAALRILYKTCVGMQVALHRPSRHIAGTGHDHASSLVLSMHDLEGLPILNAVDATPCAHSDTANSMAPLQLNFHNLPGRGVIICAARMDVDPDKPLEEVAIVVRSSDPVTVKPIPVRMSLIRNAMLNVRLSERTRTLAMPVFICANLSLEPQCVVTSNFTPGDSRHRTWDIVPSGYFMLVNTICPEKRPMLMLRDQCAKWLELDDAGIGELEWSENGPVHAVRHGKLSREQEALELLCIPRSGGRLIQHTPPLKSRESAEIYGLYPIQVCVSQLSNEYLAAAFVGNGISREIIRRFKVI